MISALLSIDMQLSEALILVCL